MNFLVVREIVLIVALLAITGIIIFVPDSRTAMYILVTGLITQRVSSQSSDKTVERTVRHMSFIPRNAPEEAKPLLQEAMRMPMRSSTGFSEPPKESDE
jgi:hypothetical protein